MRFRRSATALTIAATLAVPAAATATSAGAAGAGAATIINWPAYLLDAGHSSDNAAATAITPATAPTLALAWKFKAAKPTMTGQPNPGL